MIDRCPNVQGKYPMPNYGMRWRGSACDWVKFYEVTDDMLR